MRAIILLGWRSSDSGPAPEALYVGVDGVEAGNVAAEAQASGEFIKLGRINNPSVVPLPHVPNINADGTQKSDGVEAGNVAGEKPKRKYTRRAPKPDASAPAADAAETTTTETQSENQN